MSLRARVRRLERRLAPVPRFAAYFRAGPDRWELMAPPSEQGSLPAVVSRADLERWMREYPHDVLVIDRWSTP